MSKLDELELAIESLNKTAMRVKEERDLLLGLICNLYQQIDNVYDVDQPIGGPRKEYPFSGAGVYLEKLRSAMERCGVKP